MFRVCKEIEGVWVHLIFFLPSIQKGTTFVTSCLLPGMKKSLKKGSAIKGKNLLLEEQILSFKR